MTEAAAFTVRRTMRISVTTMEEAPVLSQVERAEMTASVKSAEAEIAAGNFVKHDPVTFVENLMAVQAKVPGQEPA